MRFKITSIAVNIILGFVICTALYGTFLYVHQTQFPILAAPATVQQVRRENGSYYLNVVFKKKYDIFCEYHKMQTYLGELGGNSSAIRNAFKLEQGTRLAGTYFIQDWEIETNESIKNVYAVVTHSCFGGISKIRALFMLGSEIDEQLTPPLDTPDISAR